MAAGGFISRSRRGIDPSTLFPSAAQGAAGMPAPGPIQQPPQSSQEDQIVSMASALMDQLGLTNPAGDPGPPPITPAQEMTERNQGKNFFTRRSAGGVPGWAYAVTGALDLLSQAKDEDYDPDTEYPDEGPGPLQSLVGIDVANRRGRDAAYLAERQDWKDTAGSAAETLKGNRTSANSILPGVIANVTKRNEGDDPEKLPPSLATWKAIQEQDWFKQLSPEEQARTRDGILGVPAPKPGPKDIQEEARQKRAGMLAADKELGVGQFKPPKTKDAEADFAEERYRLYTSKPGLYTMADARRGFPRTLTPDEAATQVDADMKQFRSIRQKYPRQAGSEPAGQGPDLSNLDPDLAALVQENPELLDVITAMQGAPKGSQFRFQTGGVGTPTAPQDSPGLGPYYPEGQGFLSSALSLGSPMAGAPPTGPAAAPQMAPQPPMPQGPGGAPDPAVLIQSYRNYIRANPAERENARRQFLSDFGFDPEKLEQSAAGVR